MLAQGEHRALRHQVVGREHPVQVRLLREQSLHRGLAAALGEVPFHTGDVRAAVAGHRLPEAGQPVLGGGHSGGAADDGDLPAAPGG